MIGNDDCGQMSAWYILSTLGFYPVNPANGQFVLGSPQVKKAKLHVPNNSTFSINARNYSNENIVHDKVKLNQKELNRPYITYAEIMVGGHLDFQMTPQ